MTCKEWGATGHVYRPYDGPGERLRCKCGEEEPIGEQGSLDFSQGDFRPRARKDDPETSHTAAASVGQISESMAAILITIRMLGEGPDETVYAKYEELSAEAPDKYPPRAPSGYRTLRKELVRRRLVEDSGKRTRLASGRRAIIWRPTRGDFG